MAILHLVGLALLIVTIVIHGLGTSWWLNHLITRYQPADGQFSFGARLSILIMTAVVLVCLHLVEILLWAGAYLQVAPEELQTLEAAVYFSAVTFTTLGYGDITLSSDWRLLSGIEAINGIVLIGWTTAFLFAVLGRTWNPLNDGRRPGG